MPRIVEYNNTQQLSGQPLESAAYSTERYGQLAGRAYQHLGNVGTSLINQVEQHVARRETAKLAAGFTTQQAALWSQLQDAKANGQMDDPNFVKKFMENAQNSLNNLGDGLMTSQAKDYYTKMNASVASHLFQTASTEHAQYESESQLNDVNKSLTVNSTLAYHDPGQAESLLGQMNTTIDTLAAQHNIPKPEAEKWKQSAAANIATSAAEGMINANPAQAYKDLTYDC